MRTAIVTAADAGYFPLLRDLLLSIAACRPEGDSTEVCVLDTGLTADQRAELGDRVKRFIEPGWDIPVAPSTPAWFKAMTARPFLPKHFPEYDALVWIDADAWLQDWRAIELMITAARDTAGIAIVPEIHRAYTYLYRWHGESSPQLLQSYLPFGEDLARRLVRMPILNSGVFAMRTDAPHWRAWQDLVRHGIVGQPFIRTIEQCALNVAVYSQNLPFQPLPAWCNWVCYHALPAYRVEDRSLGEATPPFEKLSIVHLSGRGEDGIPIRLGNGQQSIVPIRFAPFRAFCESIG